MRYSAVEKMADLPEARTSVWQFRFVKNPINAAKIKTSQLETSSLTKTSPASPLSSVNDVGAFW